MVWSSDIGIDLGTATILVFLWGRGIVLNEPAVVAIDQQTNKVLAIGVEAQKMLGRTPGNIVTLRPLKAGVIADFDLTEIMLKYCITRACQKRKFFRPRVVVCIPAVITAVERKAVVEAISKAGARETYLIEEPRAAALGAGLDLFEPCGNMVVDVGGGTTDIAVLSMGEIVVGASVRVGGYKFDEAIIRFVKKEFNLLIGERMAESLKIAAGSACPDSRYLQEDVRGRDLVSGLPRSVSVSTQQIVQALEEPLNFVLQGVKEVLEKTPPELAGDIAERGIVMTGGGALLDGFAAFLTQAIGVHFYLAEDPVSCVVKGTAMVLDNMNKLSSSLLSGKKIAARY